MVKLATALCVLLVMVATPWRLEASWLYINAFQYSDPLYDTNVFLDLSDVAGVTGARATRADGTPIILGPEFTPQTFGAWAGPFASFSDMHTATVGTWQLAIEFGAGNEAVYDVVVNEYRTPFTAASFPPAPTLISPFGGAIGVAPTPTFTWDNGGLHTGAMESLFVSVWSEVNPAIGAMDSSGGGGLGLNDQTWTPPGVLPGGPASFLVQYELNENEDAVVETPQFNGTLSTVADPGITWDWSGGDLYSRDLIEFTVVPEPATMALLAAGVVSLVFGRSRKR